MGADRPHLAVFGDVQSIHVRRWADHFSRNGYRVTVISYHERPSADSHSDFDYVYWVWPRKWHWIGNRFWVPRCRMKLRRLLRRIGADILHVHYLNFSSVAAGSGVKHIPVVFTAWGSDLNLAEEFITFFLTYRRFRQYLGGASIVTVDAPTLRDRYLELATRPAPVTIIRFGADLSVFRPGTAPAELRRELRLPDGARTVLFVRGFWPPHNAKTIVQAAPAVLEKVPNAFFVMKTILDDTENRRGYAAEVREMIDAMGLSDRFRLDGRNVDHPKIADYMRLSDVIVNIPDVDALPASLMESMACGLPSVSAPLAAYEGVFTDGQTGLAADPHDPSDVAAKIIRLLTDEPLRTRMSAEARRVAERVADWNVEMRRMARIYKDLLAGRTPPAEPAR